MRNWFIIAGVVWVAGCNAPSPGFYGVAPTRISVEQSVFDIRIKDNRAEAMRINREWAPNMNSVAPRAVAAIEQVSGYAVTDLTGDQALMFAKLECRE